MVQLEIWPSNLQLLMIQFLYFGDPINFFFFFGRMKLEAAISSWLKRRRTDGSNQPTGNASQKEKPEERHFRILLPFPQWTFLRMEPCGCSRRSASSDQVLPIFSLSFLFLFYFFFLLFLLCCRRAEERKTGTGNSRIGQHPHVHFRRLRRPVIIKPSLRKLTIAKPLIIDFSSIADDFPTNFKKFLEMSHPILGFKKKLIPKDPMKVS